MARAAASGGLADRRDVGHFGQDRFAATPTTPTPMAAGALATAGGNQAHDNMPPYLVLNFAIALVGIFPSRN